MENRDRKEAEVFFTQALVRQTPSLQGARNSPEQRGVGYSSERRGPAICPPIKQPSPSPKN